MTDHTVKAYDKDLEILARKIAEMGGIAEKMLRGFVFFERSERNFLKHADFDPFKEEDPQLTSPETWQNINRAFGGEFLGFGLWFN